MMTTDLRPERARHLFQVGLSSVDIAADLGATTAQVNDWLGPAVTTVTADPEPAPSTATADELAAMHIVVAALEKLTPTARRRVTEWVHAHLGNGELSQTSTYTWSGKPTAPATLITT